MQGDLLGSVGKSASRLTDSRVDFRLVLCLKEQFVCSHFLMVQAVRRERQYVSTLAMAGLRAVVENLASDAVVRMPAWTDGPVVGAPVSNLPCQHLSESSMTGLS